MASYSRLSSRGTWEVAGIPAAQVPPVVPVVSVVPAVPPVPVECELLAPPELVVPPTLELPPLLPLLAVSVSSPVAPSSVGWAPSVVVLPQPKQVNVEPATLKQASSNGFTPRAPIHISVNAHSVVLRISRTFAGSRRLRSPGNPAVRVKTPPSSRRPCGRGSAWWITRAEKASHRMRYLGWR